MSRTLPNRISLAQWSLHRMLFDGSLDPGDFPKMTIEVFGLDAVEYVNSFYRTWATDEAYFRRLRKTCDGLGVRSLLIMCDGEGDLGDADPARRRTAVENHRKWLEAAKILGCHSIRVNARSSGSYEEQRERAADGLAALGALAEPFDLDVLVENHGGLSSHGAWLAGVITTVARSNVGTLPDFGNFQLADGTWYDRYKGVIQLMPFAKAVSAKSHAFNEDGDETRTDFARMMQIVRDADYTGYVGIEYEGQGASEREGVLKTKFLLERCGCLAPKD